MSWLDVVLTAVALAMDAFAVAVSSGMCMRKDALRQGLRMAGSFGLFQGVMPLIGFGVALTFADSMQAVDHWIAFLLLAFVGGKAIKEGIRGDEEETANPADIKNLLMMSVATSIDAMAVGASFTLMEQTGVLALAGGIFWICGAIAVITFALSFIGVRIGCRVGHLFGKYAQIGGGVVLLLIGLKILLQDLLG